MSRLVCTCGHIIRDQTDHLPYKGMILKDYDSETMYEAIERESQALVDAVLAGDRESWLRRHFRECYPRDLSHGSVFHDFVSLILAHNLMIDVYECESCGRLWVQRGVSDNQFVPFMPESGKVEHTLRSEQDKRGLVAEETSAPESS